jgi:hypothetical protein
MKTMNSSFVLLIGAFLSCVGCASLQSVSMTNIPRGAERARPIQARENNLAFLGIHFDNAFADGVPEDLRRQCPNGKVTGVYAKYETKWYVLVEDRSVTAKAYCVPAEATQTPAAATGTPVLPPPPAAPPAAPAANLTVKRTGGSS